MPPFSLPRRPRTWILLVVALAAVCLILLFAATLQQQQWAILHQTMDNLRGALAPDTGGKAACRAGLLVAIERAMAGRRLAFRQGRGAGTLYMLGKKGACTCRNVFVAPGNPRYWFS